MSSLITRRVRGMKREQLQAMIDAKLSPPEQERSPALNALLRAVVHSQRVVNNPHTCKHGHKLCSYTDGGECGEDLWREVIA